MACKIKKGQTKKFKTKTGRTVTIKKLASGKTRIISNVKTRK